MVIHRQLCFLASLLLVIHAGPISQPSDKDEAIAEVRCFSCNIVFACFAVAHSLSNNSLFICLLGLPEKLLQYERLNIHCCFPSRRKQGSTVQEDERDAEVLRAKGDWKAEQRNTGGDEEAPLWSSRCWRVLHIWRRTQMADQQAHLQVCIITVHFASLEKSNSKGG